ncbi:DinB family protein [candidate division KSB1 bacterium]|nr:DinB family protein [candidate division KSB1 bacterium]
MKLYFQQQLDYDHWANRQVLESLATCPTVPPKAVDLLGHLLIAQLFVFEVLNGRDGAPLHQRPLPTFHECAELIDGVAENWQNYLLELSEEGVLGFVHFRNSRGEQVTRVVTDLLAHVGYHSTHHRGQIATVVQQAGGVPARTDYPIYLSRGNS